MLLGRDTRTPASPPALSALTSLAIASLVAGGLSAQTQLGTELLGEAQYDQFGSAVAISGDGARVAAASSGNDGGGAGAGTGHVRVYDRQQGTWSRLGGVDLDGVQAAEAFGASVALDGDGDRVVVGAPSAVPEPGKGPSVARGAFAVLAFDGTQWSPIGTRVLGTGTRDRLGVAVAISRDGRRVVAGGLTSNAFGFPGPGVARVYEEDATGQFVQLGGDLPGDGGDDRFGSTVAISGDGTHVAVASGQANIGDQRTGLVRVYDYDAARTPAWQQVGADFVGLRSERLGQSVSLSHDGTRLAVGVPGHSVSAGKVEVYARTGAGWQLLGAPVVGANQLERVGHAVALDSAGQRVCVGAVGGGNVSSNLNGRVGLYEFNGTAWTQVGTHVTGTTYAEQFGFAVGLSADGTRYIGGGIYASRGAVNQGRAVVYAADGVVLPVELTAFTATATDGRVDLRWRTATERGASHFAVERSGDGRAWSSIARVAAAGDADAPRDYGLRDDRPLAGVNYYRLRQVDRDGSAAVSETVVAYVGGGGDGVHAVSIYPNPARGSVTVTGAPAGAELSIRDLAGRLAGRPVRATSSDAAPPRFDVSTLPTGVYLLYVRGPGGTSVRRLLVGE